MLGDIHYMRTASTIAIGLIIGLGIGWFGGRYQLNLKSREGVDSTSRFPEINAYIAEAVPFLQKRGVSQIQMKALPYEGGGAVLVHGSVSNGDEFYILHHNCPV